MNQPGPYPPNAMSDPNPRWMNVVLIGLVVGFLYIVFYFRPFGSVDWDDHPLVDQPVVWLEFQEMDDLDTRVTWEGWKGQVVQITFWGPWSIPSLDQIPQFDQTYEKYKDRSDFTLLAVACDRPGGPMDNIPELRDDVEFLFHQHQIQFPVHIDPRRYSRARLEKIGSDRVRFTHASSYPMTLVVDRYGFVRGVWQGYRSSYESEINEKIAELLASGVTD